MKKNVKDVTNYLISEYNNKADGLEKLVENWSHPSKELGLSIVSIYRNTVKCFENIAQLVEPTALEKRKSIDEEAFEKCKHPKNMQDVCAGQTYCMDCNADLPENDKK